jgi:6-pyruvoyltetrahydropterin/6-carboxytetrahydropterin synthase
MQITRRLEFDAGHRIPDHKSQCRHLHGHRYGLEVTVTGQIKNLPGQSDNGMVMDFSEIKMLARTHVVDVWDHAFLVWREDHAVAGFLATLPQHKTVIMDAVPTAENLARTAFEILDRVYEATYGKLIRLERVRLFETPNCWADAFRDQTGESASG